MLKEKVKEIVDSDATNEEKLNKIMNIVNYDFLNYNSGEVLELYRELTYALNDICRDYLSGYTGVIDYLKEYYLND